MSILSWNCHRLGHQRAIPALKDLVRVHRPNIIFLCETWYDARKANEVCSMIGYDGGFVVKNEGRCGGIAFFWRELFDCQVLSYTTNFINMVVTKEGEDSWTLTRYYGFLKRTIRKKTWSMIRSLVVYTSMP